MKTMREYREKKEASLAAIKAAGEARPTPFSDGPFCVVPHDDAGLIVIQQQEQRAYFGRDETLKLTRYLIALWEFTPAELEADDGE